MRNPQRRPLRFSSLEEIMPDVDRLTAGHRTVGQWSLGQICNHLSKAIGYSIDGFPGKAPWLIRKLMAPSIRKSILQTGEMSEGVKVPEIYLPKPGLDDRTEIETLRQALQRYAAFQGTLADHPFFERLSRDQWNQLHCIHCAHHLSFAVPSAGAS